MKGSGGACSPQNLRLLRDDPTSKFRSFRWAKRHDQNLQPGLFILWIILSIYRYIGYIYIYIKVDRYMFNTWLLTKHHSKHVRILTKPCRWNVPPGVEQMLLNLIALPKNRGVQAFVRAACCECILPLGWSNFFGSRETQFLKKK